MCALINRLKADYDIVLIDTAPVGQVAETMSLSHVLDTMIFVVRFDGASMSQIREALFRIQKSGKRVLGCIVNDVKSLGTARRGGYYGYGDHYHSRGPSRKRSQNRKKRAIQHSRYGCGQKRHTPPHRRQTRLLDGKIY